MPMPNSQFVGQAGGACACCPVICAPTHMPPPGPPPVSLNPVLCTQVHTHCRNELLGRLCHFTGSSQRQNAKTNLVIIRRNPAHYHLLNYPINNTSWESLFAAAAAACSGKCLFLNEQQHCSNTGALTRGKNRTRVDSLAQGLSSFQGLALP